MRYINVDKLMRKIFNGTGGKPWFGSNKTDAMVIRFVDQFYYDDIDRDAPDPKEAVFQDCALTIICLYDHRELTAKRVNLCGEYDEPWDLDYIQSKNPTARLITVIADHSFYGDVWQYGNYGPYWVHHGTTRGCA